MDSNSVKWLTIGFIGFMLALALLEWSDSWRQVELMKLKNQKEKEVTVKQEK